METTDQFHAVLVEDDVELRQAIARTFRQTRDLVVVGEAGGVAEARRVIDDAARIDLALVDLCLPDGDGADVVRHLRATRPGCVSVALTVREDAGSIFRTLRAGARGYLIKGTPPAEMMRLVREALAGGSPLSPTVARLVVGSFAEANDVRSLTPRERDVLDLLVKGLSYRQVGDTLGLATGTVQTHVKSIYDKLEVSSKAEATAVALRRGLV